MVVGGIIGGRTHSSSPSVSDTGAFPAMCCSRGLVLTLLNLCGCPTLGQHRPDWSAPPDLDSSWVRRRRAVVAWHLLALERAQGTQALGGRIMVLWFVYDPADVEEALPGAGPHTGSWVGSLTPPGTHRTQKQRGAAARPAAMPTTGVLTSSTVSSWGVAALSSESFCEPASALLRTSLLFLCLCASFFTCPSALPLLSRRTGLVSHLRRVLPGRLGPGELWAPIMWGWREATEAGGLASLLETDSESEGRQRDSRSDWKAHRGSQMSKQSRSAHKPQQPRVHMETQRTAESCAHWLTPPSRNVTKGPSIPQTHAFQMFTKPELR